MIDFLLLLIFPIAIAIGATLLYNKKISISELAIQCGVIMLFLAAGIGIAYWSNTDDVEFLNGQVTGRARQEVSCEHSYRCHCHEVCSGSGNSKSCSEECDTCYEHAYDVDWHIFSSIGRTVDINRVDSQGLIEPKRWDAAYLGEPFTVEHHYVNYIKANPESVLTGGKGDVEKWKQFIPSYPKVYDYYKANHYINMRTPNVDDKTWGWLVNEADKTLGPMKQVNIIVTLVGTADPSYVYALKTAWLGGKKNDAVVVIGSRDGHVIDFVDVISWATHADFRDSLRDDIMQIGTLDRKDAIIKVIYSDTKERFVRMHMKDLQYLMRSFQPSGIAMWTLFILSTIISISFSIYFIYKEQSYNQRHWR